MIRALIPVMLGLGATAEAGTKSAETCKSCKAGKSEHPHKQAAKKKNKNSKQPQKSQQPKVQTEKGPGDAPPPTEATWSKLEEMEKSLSPIEAVPVTPKS